MKALEEVIHLISDRVAILKSIVSIASLEAQLAGLSVFPTLMTLCLLVMVFIGLWLVLQLFIGYLILLALPNTLLTLGIMLVLNVVLMLILLKLFASNLRNMSFEKTRAHLFSENLHEND